MSKSDYLFINGTVYTSASQTVNATGIATSGNRIVFIGETADAIKQKNSAAEIIDLRGKFVLPGFVDAHMHPGPAAVEKMYKIQLYDFDNKSDYLNCVKICSLPSGNGLL